MRAMIVGELSGRSGLVLREVDSPRPAPHELLIRVAASGVNRADLLQRQGRYSQPALARDVGFTVAGMEAAGEVIAVGSAVDAEAVGRQVMAMCGGSYAEYVAIDSRLAMPVPPELTMPEAAALPVGMMTAYDALARTGRLARGETVLVTGATSAVGLIAVQLARALGAGWVLATTRSPDRATLLEQLGASQVLVGDGAVLTQALAKAAGAHPADVVIDHLGASTFANVLASMAQGGRYVSVGRLGGQRTELDLNVLARDRLTVSGATFRSRTIEQYADIAAGVRTHVLPQLTAGRVQPVVAARYPLDAANEALDALSSPGRAGKVVLTVGEAR